MSKCNINHRKLNIYAYIDLHPQIMIFPLQFGYFIFCEKKTNISLNLLRIWNNEHSFKKVANYYQFADTWLNNA